MALKVYQGSLEGLHNCCVAASSWKALGAAVRSVSPNISDYYLRGYWSVTGNGRQIEAAMSEPGVVFITARSSPRDVDPYIPIRSLQEYADFSRATRAALNPQSQP